MEGMKTHKFCSGSLKSIVFLLFLASFQINAQTSELKKSEVTSENKLSPSIQSDNSFKSTAKPLYVVDGVVASEEEFGEIKSSDIESLDILKDAASVMKYSSGSFGGVIVVKTKKAKQENNTER